MSLPSNNDPLPMGNSDGPGSSFIGVGALLDEINAIEVAATTNSEVTAANLISNTPPGSPVQGRGYGGLSVSDSERNAAENTQAGSSAITGSGTCQGILRTAQGGDWTEKQVSPDANMPDRFELFLLGEGEKRITEEPDTRTPNTSIFTVNKEDHTLANLIRSVLLKDKHVNFCGYRVPHPLFASFELRIQTDGEITPKEALRNACQGTIGTLGHLAREFTKEFELRKMVTGDASNDK